MSVLDTVLEYKKQKEASAAKDLMAIPQALTTFTAARAAANQNALDQLKVRSDLATHGLEVVRTPEGGFDFRRRTDLQDPNTALGTLEKVLSTRKLAAEQGFDLGSVGGSIGVTPTAGAPGARAVAPAGDDAGEDDQIIQERNMFGVPTKVQSKKGLAETEKAQKMGQKAGEAKAQVEGMKTIEEDLDAILGDWKEINSSNRGPIQGRTKGQLAKFFQSDPALVNYEDSRGLILANISREFGGEKGVLTDRDISRIEKSLPLLRDTDDVAGRKVKFIKSFIARKISAKEALSRGESYEPDLKETSPASKGGTPSFVSMDEANAWAKTAKPKPGTKIKVGKQVLVWED